eukprot:scaffold315173_cov36-Tisochrysis_lutea.AAC.4
MEPAGKVHADPHCTSPAPAAWCARPSYLLHKEPTTGWRCSTGTRGLRAPLALPRSTTGSSDRSRRASPEMAAASNPVGDGFDEYPYPSRSIA